MLARSFLFKLLNFSKSSRLVLIVTVVFVNYVNANQTSVRTQQLPFSERNQRKLQTPKPELQKFQRTPTWPA